MVKPVVIKSYGVITVPPYNLIVYLLKHPDKEIYTIKNKSYFNFREPEESDLYELDNSDDSNLYTNLPEAEEAFNQAIEYEKRLVLDQWEDVSQEVMNHRELNT